MNGYAQDTSGQVLTPPDKDKDWEAMTETTHTVTVTSAKPLDEAQVGTAVEDAGYQLAS